MIDKTVYRKADSRNPLVAWRVDYELGMDKVHIVREFHGELLPGQTSETVVRVPRELLDDLITAFQAIQTAMGPNDKPSAPLQIEHTESKGNTWPVRTDPPNPNPAPGIADREVGSQT